MSWLFGAAIYAPAQVEGAAHLTSYWCTALILVVGCITMCYKRVVGEGMTQANEWYTQNQLAVEALLGVTE